MTKAGGMVLVFSTYNENGCRVETKYSMKGNSGRIMTFSKDEIAEWLDEKGYSYEFIPFYLKAAIKKNTKNALRSYTVTLADGTNGVINGLDIWHNFYLLKINV